LFKAFFALQNFLGCWASKSCTQILTSIPTSHHVEKFREVTATGPKLIGPDTLNVRPIFELLLLKIVDEPPSPMGCALPSLGHTVAPKISVK